MPIYEFLCSDEFCGHKTESIFWIKENAQTIKCEKCGKDAHKVPSLVSDLFNKHYSIPSAGFEGSYSEKQQFLRENNLQESGDAVGGSKETAITDHYAKQKQEHKVKAENSFKSAFNKAVEKTAKDF